MSKRNAKSKQELQRSRPLRDQYPKILIVCEGEKTEPSYFTEIKNHYKINTANIVICSGSGSDPMSIIHSAKKRYKEENNANDPFDKVYCVFDKDSHTHYLSALNSIASAKPKDTWFAITSVPCFEYWLLLHFDYTTRAYSSLPNKSACDQTISDLKKYLPSYKKGQPDIFSNLIKRLENAKNNATQSLKAAKESDTDNPSTKVHELIDFMQNIKSQK